MILLLTNGSLIYHFLRVNFGQITSNQMLLSVIDELRANTISKVREIRVSPAFSAGEQDGLSYPDTHLSDCVSMCSSVFSGCPGFQ